MADTTGTDTSTSGAGATPKPEKKKTGRPKGSKSGSKGPAGALALKVKRKTPDEIKDLRSAIKRGHDEQAKMIERYRKEHPGAMVGDAVDPFTTATREPIPAAFFVNSLTPPIYTIYAALDVKSHFPPPEHVKQCAEMWSEASKHFEMSKYLVLLAAILSTAGLAGQAVLARVTAGPDSKNITVRHVEGEPQA